MSQIATDFLTRCFAPGDTIALLLRRDNGERPTQRVVRLEQALAPTYLRWLAHENATGANVYVAANPLRSGSRRRTKECIASVRHLYIYGVNVYRELEREFAVGDRLSFTAPSKELGIASRDLGTVERIEKSGQLSVRMDNGKAVTFDANEMRHFDHGYAVTSHSSQGLTAERVLVNIDTNVHPELINQRFAYVSVSRASQDAQMYTDSVAQLVSRLSRDVGKSSAIDLGATPPRTQSIEIGLS